MRKIFLVLFLTPWSFLPLACTEDDGGCGGPFTQTYYFIDDIQIHNYGENEDGKDTILLPSADYHYYKRYGFMFETEIRPDGVVYQAPFSFELGGALYACSPAGPELANPPVKIEVINQDSVYFNETEGWLTPGEDVTLLFGYDNRWNWVSFLKPYDQFMQNPNVADSFYMALREEPKDFAELKLTISVTLLDNKRYEFLDQQLKVYSYQ